MSFHYAKSFIYHRLLGTCCIRIGGMTHNMATAPKRGQTWGYYRSSNKCLRLSSPPTGEPGKHFKNAQENKMTAEKGDRLPLSDEKGLNGNIAASRTLGGADKSQTNVTSGSQYSKRELDFPNGDEPGRLGVPRDVHISVSFHDIEAPWSVSRTIALHALGMLASVALWTGASLVPFGPIYAEYGARVSGLVFTATNIPISIAISLVTVFWIRELFSVGIDVWSRTTWWPVLAYAGYNVFAYGIFAMVKLFPVPFLPIYGGGTAYSVVPPLVIYMTGLPKSIIATPGFWKKFVSSIVISGALNVYWFVLFAFYYCFIRMPQSTILQMILLVIVKMFTEFFIAVQIKLVSNVAKSLGHKEAENIGTLAKLLTECAFETYAFLVIPDMEGWAVFSFWLGLDIILLVLEIYSDYEEVIARWITKLTGAKPKPPVDHDEEIRVRVKHCLVSIHAKIFGTLVFTALLLAWRFGPNSTWYPLFSSLSVHVIKDSLLKAWISLVLIVVAGFGLMLALQYRGIDWRLFGNQFFRRYMPIFWGIYLCAPIFPYTHMGIHWYSIEYMLDTANGINWLDTAQFIGRG
ncbi:hypothetical protein DFS34DRAFT_634105 [Phlyctochytrium arcticum]|nr:hypothetical protein DFS34DRAFT_634105 [Phlyctochytrium arcticum]